MSATTTPVNLRCPVEGCNHFLVKDFIGDQVQVKCVQTGYIVRVFRENGIPKAVLDTKVKP